MFILSSVALFAAVDKNPDSKLYVADVVGESIHQDADQIEDVSKKEVFTASKTFVETKKKSNSSMVYSNATGIFFDEETRLDVKKFVQEPFRPDRNDYEVEPSISQTDGFLRHGRIAICTPKLVAGSKMVYSTSNGSVNVRRGKLVMETNGDETKFYLFDGDATVKSSGVNLTEETLKKGQMATIKNGQMTIANIPNELKAKEELTDMACVARKQVYFEVKSVWDGVANMETREIVAVPAIPVEVPKEFTISPAKL